MREQERSIFKFVFVKYLLLILLFFLLITLLNKIFFSNFSISELNKVNLEQSQLNEEIAIMKENKDQLSKEKLRLSSDEGMEGLARSELGMIKEGEVFYQFEDTNPLEKNRVSD
ncbi:MAG: septum formation initiator family protein [Gammaproteobacteria bacterium]